MRLLTSVFICLTLYIDYISGESCHFKSPNCEGETCELITHECENGRCGETQCVCNPCYGGEHCSEYVNKYGPRLNLRSTPIVIDNVKPGEALHEVYVEDLDWMETCNGQDWDMCTCAHTEFFIKAVDGEPEAPFKIDRQMGTIYVDVPVPPKKYRVEVYVQSRDGSPEEKYMTRDAQKLNITVRYPSSQKHEEGYHSNEDLPFEINSDGFDYNQDYHQLDSEGLGHLQDIGSQRSSEANLEPHKRTKRGATGTDESSTEVELVYSPKAGQSASEPTNFYPGTEVCYDALIKLPEITTADTLYVEIFGMDAISGQTAFAICEVDGLKKTGSSVNANPAKFSQTAHSNSFHSQYVDRYVLMYQDIKTSCSYSAGDTDYSECTITAHFCAIRIDNPDYTNSSVYLTVGAEFTSGQYVWIAIVTKDAMAGSGLVFPADAEIDTDDPITDLAVGESSFFEITTFITKFTGKVTLEIINIDGLLDVVSVENLQVGQFGSNFDNCLGAVEKKINHYPSTTKETNARAVAEFTYNLVGVNAADLMKELTNDNNKFMVGFSLQVGPLANVGDLITVGVGMTIADYAIFTCLINITVTGPPTIPSTAPPSAYSLVDFGGLETEQYGAVAFGIQADLTRDGTNTITCTAPAKAERAVSGVAWGDGGKHQGFKGNMDVTYNDDGSASWTVISGTTKNGDGSADFGVMIVTVTYSGTDPSGALSVDCDGTAVALGGVTYRATASKEDISGSITPLVSGIYNGGYFGVKMTLEFPANGAGYPGITLETTGDFAVTGWGAEVCAVSLYHAGFAAGSVRQVNYSNAVIDLSAPTSKFTDGVTLDLGSVSGATMNDIYAADRKAEIHVAYRIPPGQSLSSGTYNVYGGLVTPDEQTIWAASSPFTVNSGDYSYDKAKPGYTTLVGVDDPITGGAISTVKLALKASAGSANAASVTFSVPDTTITAVCAAKIAHIGRSYPCMTNDLPDNDPTAPVKLTWDASDRALGGFIDLGILQPLIDDNDAYFDQLSDDDAIIILFFVAGISAGSQDLTMKVDIGGTAFTRTASVTVSGDPVPAGSPLTMTVSSPDGNMETFPGVMKKLYVTLTFTATYSNTVQLRIDTTDIDIVSLCVVGIKEVGDNLPCLLPTLTTTTRTLTGVADSVLLDLGLVSHFLQDPDSAEANDVIILVGVGHNVDVDSTFDITPVENGVDGTTETITLTRSAGTYVEPVNQTYTGMELGYTDNTTTGLPWTVGLMATVQLSAKIPPSVEGKVEIGAMFPFTNSSEAAPGRAYGTVHSIKMINGRGRNLGCLGDPPEDKIVISQTSVGVSPIHLSQMNSLVADMGFITNTDLGRLVDDDQPGDDVIDFELMIQLADVDTVSDGDNVTMEVAFKIGEVICVFDVNLMVDKLTVTPLIAINSNMSTLSPAGLKAQNDRVEFNAHWQHDFNISSQECNDAFIRVLKPNFMIFVEGTDTFSSSIENTTLVDATAPHLDFDIGYLFFTDELELNFSLTVDPNNDMMKGLGQVQATIIARLVCSPGAVGGPLVYPAATVHQVVEVDGTDCFDDLSTSTFTDCQFSASTAIDETTGPALSKPGSTGFWSPAVRSGAGWQHYITVNFLKKIRVTSVRFYPGTGRQVDQFSVYMSHDGHLFKKSCTTTHTAVSDGLVKLPLECRFMARYARLVVESMTGSSSAALTLQFEFKGCDVNNDSAATCVPRTTILTNDDNWRHALYDNVNGILYFCDYSMKKQRNVCYSTPDGKVFNSLPSFIGKVVGFDAATSLTYSMDSKGRTMMSSEDGVTWGLVDNLVAAGIQNNAVAIPGKTESDLDVISIGGVYEADFTGILNGGTYVVKWTNCCS